MNNEIITNKKTDLIKLIKTNTKIIISKKDLLPQQRHLRNFLYN